MTIAIILICMTLAYREIMFMHERKGWLDERKDLYSRIQAGSLQEYVQSTKTPSTPVVRPVDMIE